MDPFLTRLLELPFDAFARLVARLLPALGYSDVRLAGRRDFKGRNGRDGAGGFDLLASRFGRTVLVQLKQFSPQRLLFQRSLDELRGVVLRAGAAESLLVTTGAFSLAVDREALRRASMLPISTLDGSELLTLLIENGIGIKPSGKIDEELLASLTQEASGNSPGDCMGKSNCTGKAEFVVTVGVQRVHPAKKVHPAKCAKRR
ncbi:restriction endonuclease [Armatimonas sp.]|uniref:restriction endonuclease n=1 Tax=Armatimonas sp. TaxID=1872638 RepID=UPI003752A47D